MYIPTSSAESDRAKLHEFIRRNSFAVLTSHGGDGLVASHLPLLLDADADRYHEALAWAGPRVQEEVRTMIRNYEDRDRAEWLRMRKTLWEDCPDEQQVREMEEVLDSDTDEVFFAERPGGGLCGFLEAALRSRANGCDSTPVGYIEGWYVNEDMRRQDVGRALVEAAEAWARARGCRQMASDAELWNEVSHQAHGAVGYEETARLVLFKKDLD